MSILAEVSPAQMKKYLDRRAADAETLFQAARDRNGPQIREITHRIKGNAALYGFPDLGILAGKISHAVEDAGVDWNSVDASLKTFAEEIQTALRNVEARET